MTAILFPEIVEDGEGVTIQTFLPWEILSDGSANKFLQVQLANHNGEHYTSRLGLSLHSIFLNLF